eukprot:snap_masked-scaffold_21-processed-gene-2.25-mRNA-1 protein AED:1.00 eAED:1.00 QI:0/0/0/0/1/1/2/0/59
MHAILTGDTTIKVKVGDICFFFVLVNGLFKMLIAITTSQLTKGDLTTFQAHKSSRKKVY